MFHLVPVRLRSVALVAFATTLSLRAAARPSPALSDVLARAADATAAFADPSRRLVCREKDRQTALVDLVPIDMDWPADDPRPLAYRDIVASWSMTPPSPHGSGAWNEVLDVESHGPFQPFLKAPDNLHFIFDAPELKKPDDIPALAKRIGALGVVPGLIVIDTFARCFHGDENSSGEIGAAIREVEKLRASCDGATVLLVHHSTKGRKKTYRGSSALKGALDSMMAVERTGKTINVGIEKQKDAKEAKGLKLKLEEVTLPHFDCFGDPITSCVLVGDGQADASFDASEHESQRLLVLASMGELPVQNAEWQRAVGPVVPKNSFDHLKTPMKDKGWIMGASGTGTTKRWMLTAEGEEVVRFIQSKEKAETATASSEAAGPAPSPSTSSDGTLALVVGGTDFAANE